jgi:Cd2+/Zn2+-exporting ATPase
MTQTDTAVCAVCELHAEAVFRVEGMDCNEEVVILERRLKPLAGLEAVSADLIGQRLHVKYDAAKLTTSAIVDAVGQTGMRMWLEHEEPTSDDRALAWRWRLMVAAGTALAGALVLSASGNDFAAAVAFVAAALAGGVFPARRAVAAIRSRTLDINTLMVVAVTGALLLREWFEAAAVVCLFAVAQWLELRTMERARHAIRALIDLSPRHALVRRNGIGQVPVENIQVGDEVLVRPGDKIPLDGTVIAGHSDVNEAPLTGESLPVDKGPGDEVFAGSINGHGALDIAVTRMVRDTRLARIIHLVEMAQASRAPIQSFVDRFARVYTPAVLVLAVLVATVPAALGSADAAAWVYRALVLLVISCPCALVISTPVSIVSALSAAARNGVLVKGGVHLERLASVRVVAFDKTGTLTRGELTVTDVVTFSGAARSDVLRYAAAVETRSEHPLAQAIVAYARTQQVEIPEVATFSSIPGLGAEALVDGAPVLVGNERLMRERAVDVPSEVELERARTDGRSVVVVAINGTAIGAVALADRPRETAREAIELMREQGVRWVAMLTGDHRQTAARVADELKLDEYHAELLPAQKHDFVHALSQHGPVLMVGDGVNDAPAIAAAHVGIAMGAAGSDVALETADVALMSDELLRVPYSIRLARATLRNVRMNVAISLALKAAFLVMAISGAATLWMAVLADTGAAVIVVGNALRLLRAR